jgi:hypothetical protein
VAETPRKFVAARTIGAQISREPLARQGRSRTEPACHAAETESAPRYTLRISSRFACNRDREAVDRCADHRLIDEDQHRQSVRIHAEREMLYRHQSNRVRPD